MLQKLNLMNSFLDSIGTFCIMDTSLLLGLPNLPVLWIPPNSIKNSPQSIQSVELHSLPYLSLTPFAVSPDVRGAYFGSLDGAFEGFTFVDETPTQMLLSSSVQNRGAFMTAMSQRK